MDEWNNLISVLGTLSGTALGFIVSYLIELRKTKSERENEYRQELKHHLDDIIKPLFKLLQELWGDLGVLQESLRHNKLIIEGKSIEELAKNVLQANSELQIFVGEHYEDMSFIFPSPFPWIFTPLDELVKYKIIKPISLGEKPIQQITLTINQMMKIQKDLRRLVGYEIKIKMDTNYPFEAK